jgi:hypothetical protein
MSPDCMVTSFRALISLDFIGRCRESHCPMHQVLLGRHDGTSELDCIFLSYFFLTSESFDFYALSFVRRMAFMRARPLRRHRDRDCCLRGIQFLLQSFFCLFLICVSAGSDLHYKEIDAPSIRSNSTQHRISEHPIAVDRSNNRAPEQASRMRKGRGPDREFSLVLGSCCVGIKKQN